MTGRVVLVGGGPGDPDLLTLRAWRALATADVVVTDRLGPRSVLDDLPPHVEVIDVGKTPGNHPMPQDRIDALLVDLARRGKVVVRLKGGDPFLFGRGGEEVAACRAAGVPVEVVPGVSSALAAPAAAGIPVTHRGVASSVQVVHGHEAVPDAAVAALAAGSTTLVVLMGVATLPDLQRRALAGGVDPATPCAVVERATTPDQRVTRCPLGALAATAAEVGVAAPAVVVVGAVAAPDLLGPLPAPATLATAARVRGNAAARARGNAAAPGAAGRAPAHPAGAGAGR